MGFDAIDRQFRRPEPVKLECVRCGSTDRVEMSCSVACFDGATQKMTVVTPSQPLCFAHQRDNSNAVWNELLAPKEIRGNAGWLEG